MVLQSSEHPLLSVVNIAACYHEVLVLESVTFCVGRGMFAVLIGPNGGGKSTLMQILIGIKKAEKGEVHFRFSKQSAAPLAYVPQKKSIDWHFPITVGQVVMMGRYPYQNFFARPCEYDFHLVHEALKKVGMDHLEHRQIGMLSGGQQQRVFFARALAQEPEFYLLDEPFAAVDKATEDDLLMLLKEEQAKGKTLLMVHHDLNTIATYADYVVLLNKNVIAASSLEHCSYADLVRGYGRPIISWHKDE